MNRAAIRLGLSLTLLTAAGRAQQIAAGAKAVVSSDKLPVYAAMSETGAPKATLKRGDRVIIGMVLFGSDTTWCAISREGETKRFGYASCEFLEPASSAPPTAPETPTVPPAPVAPAPPPKPAAAPAPKAPITIREVPPAKVVIHEPAPDPPKSPPPAPVTPPPPPPAPKPADFVESVLDGPGVRAELTNYTKTTRLSAFLDKGRLAEIDSDALNRVVATQFQSKVFLKAIGDQMRKSYGAERVAPVVEWIGSPAAQKLAELERRAYSPVARQELVDFAETLSATPPPEPRLILIHRIYDAARTCDLEVEATIALVYTTAQAIGPVLPSEKRYSANELDRALGGVKSRYRAVMKNARIVQYLFAYRSAADADLEQYAAFLESGSGQWLTAAIDKGFFDATEVISQRLRDEISRNVKPHR